MNLLAKQPGDGLAPMERASHASMHQDIAKALAILINGFQELDARIKALENAQAPSNPCWPACTRNARTVSSDSAVNADSTCNCRKAACGHWTMPWLDICPECSNAVRTQSYALPRVK